jgi:hypothetical protein
MPRSDSPALLAALCIPLTLSACRTGPAPATPGLGGCLSAADDAAERRFLRDHQPDYLRAIARARRFLDGLAVDPLELRAHGIKGKKKLVEALDAYRRLLQIADPPEKGALLDRIRELAAVTYEDRYHDMQTLDERQLDEDATSYLRAAYLLGRMGLDIERYRREIALCQPRLDARLARRGPHQRLAFHTYYAYFHLEEPFPLETSLQKGVIAARRDPATLPLEGIYGLTHEVFVPFDFGDALDAHPFSADDMAYLAPALDTLVARAIAANDPDLVAELCACLRYLRLVHRPSYRDALSFLLASQNEDGSFGHYERESARLHDFVRQGYYLHTTMVAIEALALSFHAPESRAGIEVCPP